VQSEAMGDASEATFALDQKAKPFRQERQKGERIIIID